MRMNHYYTLGLLMLLNVGMDNSGRAQTVGTDSVIAVSAQNRQSLRPVAFGEQAAWRITGAISSVSGEDLDKNFTTNLANTLYGRLPGLTVQQSGGEPGNDSPTVLARGIGTFNAGRAPLVMIDGFEGAFEQLVPSEIESVSLLKDASATAIYGLRGANGVLLVTTKRGRSMPLLVELSTRQGFHTATRLPQFLGSYDYARLFNEGLRNDGRATLYTDEALEAYRTGSDPYFYPNVNWYSEVLRKTAPISDYNLNFRGGSNTVRYFVLLNALRSNGLYKNVGDLDEESINSRYSRFNFRSNVDINITNRLSATLLLGGTVEDKGNPAAYTTGGVFNSLATLPPNAFPVYNPDGSFGGTSALSNPLANLLETGSYTSNGRVLQSSLKLTEQLDALLPGLSISAAVAFNNLFRSYSNKTKTYERYGLSRNTAGEIAYTRFGQNTSLVGNEAASDQWRSTIYQGFLNYDRTFGKHDVSAMLLYYSSNYTNIDNTTTPIESLPYKHVGLGGRFTYTNGGKYIGEFSFGYMGSEAFPKSNRFGFFPAASVGWIVSNEKFLKNQNLVSFLKARLSYGLTGNSQIGGSRFMFEQRFPYTASYFFGTNNTSFPALAEGQLATRDLRWESERKLNVGIEMTLAKRFDLTLDVFRQNRFDILAAPNRTVPQYTGMTMPLLNLGKVQNNGFEATIRFHNRTETSGRVRYSVEAGAWYARNRIVDNAEAIRLYDYQYTTGRAIGQPFGLEAIGFYRDAADIAASPRPIFASVQPGDIKYKDQNGDGLVDGNDVAPVGKPGTPTLTLSLHPRIQYRGFDLELLLQGVTGRTAYFGGSLFHAFQNNGQVSPLALDRWTPETAETATYPRLSASNNLNNFRYSSFWQRDGSFAKLRSIELGYTLPTPLLDKLRLATARVFINGTNVFSLDRMEGYIDPEVASGYPALRTLSGGVRFQF